MGQEKYIMFWAAVVTFMQTVMTLAKRVLRGDMNMI